MQCERTSFIVIFNNTYKFCGYFLAFNRLMKNSTLLISLFSLNNDIFFCWILDLLSYVSRFHVSNFSKGSPKSEIFHNTSFSPNKLNISAISVCFSLFNHFSELPYIKCILRLGYYEFRKIENIFGI